MADSGKAGPSKDSEAKAEQRLEKQEEADAKEHEGFSLPEKKTEKELAKEEKEGKWEAGAEVDPDASPASSNPIRGAHLGSVEGAVDLTEFPGEAEPVYEDDDSEDED